MRDLHEYKRGSSVKVTHERSDHFGRIGNVYRATNKEVFIDFGDGKFTAVFRWQIEPWTKFTKRKVSQPTKSRLDLINEMHNESMQAAKYSNSGAPVVMAKFCESLLSCTH